MHHLARPAVLAQVRMHVQIKVMINDPITKS
jgi:hypothetical protein